jgi:hypothetical protein
MKILGFTSNFNKISSLQAYLSESSNLEHNFKEQKERVAQNCYMLYSVRAKYIPTVRRRMHTQTPLLHTQTPHK